jgi:methyl-accepting chemotaxis protein
MYYESHLKFLVSWSMISIPSNWVSLRTKITGLAIIPALVCSIIFGLLIWLTSHSTAKLVGQELTNFMAERTSRACIHGWNTSVVTYGYVMETLEADMQTARLMLEKDGGAHLNAGRKATWQAVNDETNDSSAVTIPTIAIGSWQAASDSGAGPLQAISTATGRGVVLFERMDPEGDMMRVGGAAAEIGAHTALGSYVPARLNDEPNPILQTILAGNVYKGRLYLQGGWNTVVCTPLREGQGEVFGMMCVGMNNGGIRSLREELAANYVGANGSVAVFYVHGRDRGKLLIEPTGIAKATQARWFPVILEKSLNIKDKQVDETTQIHDDATGADVVVRFTYFEPFDWAIAIIADSRDLQLASNSVDSGFRKLLWQTFLIGIVALALAMLLALRLSKRLIDPMADLTIRLTSNATSIASSARQQASNVANINTSGNEIATAVNQISATSKELLRAMEQLAEDAEKTSTVATEGSRGLKGLSSSMESLSSATHSITDKLTTIRTKANKINSVVTAITKVADQTNLLSLNAAIEAEKAGEGGAGFAVVAREIRRLADQSALASMEIEQMVEAMQEAVSSGVAQTRELTEAMDRGIQASESISGQFGDIVQRVESMAPRYEAVHEGMQNQSEGAQQISEAMWQLTEMGRQTSESVDDLNGVSQQLHEAVRILKERIIHATNGDGAPLT